MHATSRQSAFDRDASVGGGYVYTTNARLSSTLANRRLSEAALGGPDAAGKAVVDIGCGDGTYTVELFELARPASLCGVDYSEAAVRVATSRAQHRRISFGCASAYGLPFRDNAFDIAYLRGVLHHLDDPASAIREAFRVARTVLIVEPNGYNPGLKAIEKLSRYHREHGEKSYRPDRLDRWIAQQHATVVSRKWIGLVPMFCPDWLARVAKAIEPFVERTPVVRWFSCAAYVVVAEKDGSPAASPRP